MDHLRPEGPQALYTPVSEQDGNLVMEFMFTELYTLMAIENDNLRAYTCAAEQYDFLTCLDIAAPSTLAGTVDFSSSPIQEESDLFSTMPAVYNDEGSTYLFGTDRPCDGKVTGDWQISGLDMLVLMYVQFRVPPYDNVLSTTFTVNGEGDIARRCADNITRGEFNARYDQDNPCKIPSNLPHLNQLRRLAESDGELRGSVHLHHVDSAYRGAWFHIHMESAVLAMELFLEGVNSPREVQLSNRRAPWNISNPNEDFEPHNARNHEVRFVRQLEYIQGGDGAERECSVVQGILAGNSMYKNTIGIGQVPYRENSNSYNQLFCPIDLFVWTPETTSCDVRIARGSRAMDGGGGQTLKNDLACDNTPFDFTNARAARPPPPSPPADTSPPLASPPPAQSPPPSSSTPPAQTPAPPPAIPGDDDGDDDDSGRGAANFGIAVALSMLALCCGVVAVAAAYRRRREDEEEEENAKKAVILENNLVDFTEEPETVPRPPEPQKKQVMRKLTYKKANSVEKTPTVYVGPAPTSRPPLPPPTLQKRSAPTKSQTRNVAAVQRAAMANR